MVKIKLVDQQIESIVIDELKLAYELNVEPNQIDCSDMVIDPDQNLLDSIKRVLCYYMTRDDYEQWEAGSVERTSSETAFTIAVESDQIDRVVEDDLKIVCQSPRPEGRGFPRSRMNYKPESCGSFGVIEPDVSLLSAVETVLQYYMVEQDYLEWKESVK